MIYLKKLSLVVAAIAAIAFTSAANASEYKKVVHDTNGHVVRNTFNNCVLTVWPSASNECAGSGLALEDRTVYFEFGKSNLTKDAIVKLDRLAEVVKASGATITKANIFGYADMIGDTDSNKRLSQKRAQVVKGYLSKKGVSTGKADVRAFGEDAPVAKCDGVAAGKALIKCLAPNRRVEVELEYLAK